MRSNPRVLLIGPKSAFGWTESTARAFESLGCSFATIFYNRSRLRQGFGHFRRVMTKQVGVQQFTAPQWIQTKYAEWLGARASQALVRTSLAFRPDLVVILKGETLQAAVLKELKATTGATLVAWWIDHPFMNAEIGSDWREVPECIPLYDHGFVFDHSYEAPLRSAGAQSVSFLPCAADQELITPRRLTSAERATYSANISFLGAFYENRGQLVSALAGEPGLMVWGPGWKQWPTSKRSGLLRSFKGEAVFPLETSKVYNASLVNLNAHHPQTRIAGLNCRSFEILAAGGFELTDYVSGMEELLDPDREVAVYRSPEEAVELTRYYLKEPERRRRIAEAGRRRVLAGHTYHHRMRAMLAILCA